MDLDYHAKLTIHNLSALSKTARKTLAIWLRAKATECERESANDNYSKIYTSRLMK